MFGLSKGRGSVTKPHMFLYGNCQMNRLMQGLKMQPEVQRLFQVKRVPSFDAVAEDDESDHAAMVQAFRDEAKNTRIFICQAEVWDKNFKKFADLLPDDCVKIPIFSVALSSLWPYYFKDMPIRQIKVPGARGHSFPYGDTFLIRRVKQGVPTEDIVTEYMGLDINAEMPLSETHRANLDMLRKKEERSVIRVVDYIEDHFQDDRVFWTLNHATNALFRVVVGQLLAAMELPDLPPPAAGTFASSIGFGSLIHHPVHPAVIEHFKLKYLSPDSLYHHHGEEITFREWVYRYVETARIAYAAPAAAAAMT